MYKQLLKSLAKRTTKISTLSTNKTNWITSVNDEEIYVETDSSRDKNQRGEKAETGEHISFDFILDAWNELMEKRVMTADDFTRTRGRSSFLMAFFSQLPFVDVISQGNRLAIKLKEFKTDDLPNEQFHKVVDFLEEVIDGTYHPDNLRKDIKDDNLYRIKARGRQDLRLLGFLDDENRKSETLFTQYTEAEDSNSLLRELMIGLEYFKITLNILDLLESTSVREKKEFLVEIGRLIVKNSRGGNWMVESVAKERTHNLLMWLQSVDLIDENWVPTAKAKITKEHLMVNTDLRTKLIYIMRNYLDVKKESFGGNEMGRIVRNDVPSEFYKLPYITDSYVVNGSVGQGNWATVPWIAVMNKKITTSTQRGYYIVYLFSEDMQRLYLTLAQGVTESSREEMEEVKRKIRENIEMIPKVKKDDSIYLGDSKRARDYVFSTAAYIEYSIDNMPPEEELTYDLKEMVSYYEQYIAIEGSETMPVDPDANKIRENPKRTLSLNETIEHIHAYISSKGFYYEKEEVTNLFLSLKTKPFVILSGISGTGKTRMVKLFAEAVGATQENGQFTLISVRPDWSDGSDLLGYTDIKGDFQEGALTTVLKRAMDNLDKPYFVLLDEMNLARVEHYFSDFLSVMEDRDWKNGNLVTSTVITDNEGREIYLPSNIYLIGTVNMDETTHPFSKKVLDRANTIEFNRVKLDQLTFLEDLSVLEPTPLVNDVFETKYLYLKDLYRLNQDIVIKVTNELVKINEALKIMQAHIGYRVRDEISFYLAYNDMGELIPFEQALDNCILQKILPRISGSDVRVERMLRELYKIFTNKDLGSVEEFTETELTFAKYPKSAEKVVEMLRRLEEDGFTSFWISS